MNKRYTADVTRYDLDAGESCAVKRVSFDAERLMPYLQGMFNNMVPNNCKDPYIFKVVDSVTHRVVEEVFEHSI